MREKEIKVQLKKREMILTCLNKISNCINEFEGTNDISKLLELLEKLKSALDAINKIIELLEGEEKESISVIQDSNILVDEFLNYYIEMSDIIIPHNNDENRKKEESKFDKKENTEEDNNTLIISEIQGKVILPYKIKEIENILENNKDKYSNLQEVIEDRYVIPLSKYKSPAIARFREAFNLMKYKEKESLIQCFDLAFELMGNSLLNPAVITACKNLDELDIYLDYLEANEVNKFTIFDVKYEIAPILKK